MDDPTQIGEALGQAQSVQQLLGIIISGLMAALAFVIRLWASERSERASERLTAQVTHKEALAGIKADLATGKEKGRADLAAARAAWERERADFIQRERDLIEAHAGKVESLMREMQDLALAVERALDKLTPNHGGP